jgi:hypothetical protein
VEKLIRRGSGRDAPRTYQSGQARTSSTPERSAPARRAYYYSPIDGSDHPVAKPVMADGTGEAAAPRSPVNQDWVLVLEDRPSPR